MVFFSGMKNGSDQPEKVTSSILHFMSFAGGFLIILTLALSLFSYTSAAGV